jgi:hypothetical protein
MAHRARVKVRASLSSTLVQRRVCLRCDQIFLSEGPNNRLCPACREYLHAQPTPEEEYSLGYLSRL